jgi:chemotaxis protein methyltransferase CheR
VDPAALEDLEISLLLQAVYQRYGYDFRSYARASIARRLRLFLARHHCESAGELIPKVLRCEELFSQLAQTFSIPVTEMFRDPEMFASLRTRVLPVLRTYPFFKVWHAGCATGEEVYSLAILLREEGLWDRATVFGTDFNDQVLEQARGGVFPADRMQDYTRNYQLSGGTESFASYYLARYDGAVFARSLVDRVTFANHNLVTDGVFGEMHLILCRNVLMYFDQTLRDRVMAILSDSLVRGGFLCLGSKEEILHSSLAEDFEPFDRPNRIFRKRMRIGDGGRE